MKSPTLVLLAAGKGSRFGGFKQLFEFTPLKKSILEFAIHDAIEHNFKKIVIVTLEELIPVFMEKLKWTKEKIDISYTIQKNKFNTRDEVVYGTAVALLSSLELIEGKCMVLNADDFYGKSIFLQAKNFFKSADSNTNAGMIPYKLKNTMSKNGSVSRAHCIFEGNELKTLQELNQISSSNIELLGLNEESLVSMNVWLFNQDHINYLKDYWLYFFKNQMNSQLECQLPNFVEWLIKAKKIKVLKIGIGQDWIGVTYREDITWVNKKLGEYINESYYKLFV